MQTIKKKPIDTNCFAKISRPYCLLSNLFQLLQETMHRQVESKPRSCIQQCQSLTNKNYIIQKRRPWLTLAEYFMIVICKFFYCAPIYNLYNLTIFFLPSLLFLPSSFFPLSILFLEPHTDMLFYFKLLYVIFPDDRLTATEINELDKSRFKSVPRPQHSCY